VSIRHHLCRPFISSTILFTLVHKVVLRPFMGGETRARPELALRFVGGPGRTLCYGPVRSGISLSVSVRGMSKIINTPHLISRFTHDMTSKEPGTLFRMYQ
jgi:hypothetical protein